jgi:hypothetical protein
VTDDRGWPVVVERVDGGYLASGWRGGVGRYASGSTPGEALTRWAEGRLLPLRPDVARRWAPALRALSGVDDVVRGICPECQHKDRGRANPHAPDCSRRVG